MSGVSFFVAFTFTPFSKKNPTRHVKNDDAALAEKRKTCGKFDGNRFRNCFSCIRLEHMFRVRRVSMKTLSHTTICGKQKKILLFLNTISVWAKNIRRCCDFRRFEEHFLSSTRLAIRKSHAKPWKFVRYFFVPRIQPKIRRQIAQQIEKNCDNLGEESFAKSPEIKVNRTKAIFFRGQS